MDRYPSVFGSDNEAMAEVLREIVRKRDNDVSEYESVGFNVVLQSLYAEYSLNTDISASIPVDDTIPLVSEGEEILSITITPKYPTSKIRAYFSCFGATSVNGYYSGAIFAGSTCLKAGAVSSIATSITDLQLCTENLAGDITPITYSVRVGTSGAGVLRLNGTSAARLFGGVAKATFVVEEIRA